MGDTMPSLELLLTIHLNIFDQTKKNVFTTFAGEVIFKKHKYSDNHIHINSLINWGLKFQQTTNLENQAYTMCKSK